MNTCGCAETQVRYSSNLRAGHRIPLLAPLQCLYMMPGKTFRTRSQREREKKGN